MSLVIDNPQLEAEIAKQAQAEGVTVEMLLQKAIREHQAMQEPPSSLLGALAHYGPAPSAEEIDQNRREMLEGIRPHPVLG